MQSKGPEPGKIMPKESHSALRRNFRELLATPPCVETASVFDPMSARIAADLGFEVGILGGLGRLVAGAGGARFCLDHPE